MPKPPNIIELVQTAPGRRVPDQTAGASSMLGPPTGLARLSEGWVLCSLLQTFEMHSSTGLPKRRQQCHFTFVSLWGVWGRGLRSRRLQGPS